MKKDLTYLINTIKRKHTKLSIGPKASMYLKVPFTYISELKKLKANITKQNHTINIENLAFCSLDFFDGFFCSNQNKTMMIYTSDCLPIVGIGEQNNFLIHAGWQGLLDGIINTLLNHKLCQGKYDIYIGPHICQNNFQVKSDFIQKWSNVPDFNEYCHNNCFNLSKFAQSKLEPIIKSIQISNQCTFNEHTMASFRRDGDKDFTNLTILNDKEVN